MKRLRRWLWALVVALAIPAAGLAGFVLGQRHERTAGAALPILGTAPAYTMTNQLGQEVSSSSFAGKVRLVSFIFPYCTTMCPLIAAHLANLENIGLRRARLEDQVELVSFNLDPAHTGPREMRAFLAQYGWKPEDLRWQYLVGSPEETRRVVSKGFSVWYKRASLAAEDESGPVVQPEVVNKLAEDAHVDYDIVHDDVIELVDQQGRIRKVFDNADTVGWPVLLSAVRSLVGPQGPAFPLSKTAARPSDAPGIVPAGQAGHQS